MLRGVLAGSLLFAGAGAVETREPPVAAHVRAARTVEHGKDGLWRVTATENFRVRHEIPDAAGEEIARLLEEHRERLQRVWLGAPRERWVPPCDVYLYPTGERYRRSTGVLPASLGHTTIKQDRNSGRVVERTIHVQYQTSAKQLQRLLLHEGTHAGLAGELGVYVIQRWADEAIAMLEEDDEAQEAYRRRLFAACRAQTLLPVWDVLTAEEYPKNVSAFYLQSGDVARYLVALRDRKTFLDFLRTARREGNDAALQKHYGFANVAALEAAWRADVEKRANADTHVGPASPLRGKPGP